ncbi:MAG: hypothetical protein Q4Q17_04950 [Tissierellia bacterium]|nr:hypothetical protein [Tissierellia bacterium]
MKKHLLLYLLAMILFLVGCKQSSTSIATETKELNLKFLDISAAKDTFKEFAPDIIMPKDFYEGKYDKETYQIIAMDGEAVAKLKKDNHLDLLFRKDVAYLIKDYKDSSMAELYNLHRGLKTTGSSGSAYSLYRIYENDQMKVIDLNEKEGKDAHRILILLNQLYHTEDAESFNEWYVQLD